MQKIVITGGTGFVGRSICEHLAAQDAACRLVVPTRRLANGKQVQVLPTVDLVQADVHDPQAMAQLLQGADALVHLVAILHGDDDAFDRVHVQLPRSLAAACAQAGVRRVVHVSALGAGSDRSPAAPVHVVCDLAPAVDGGSRLVHLADFVEGEAVDAHVGFVLDRENGGVGCECPRR